MFKPLVGKGGFDPSIGDRLRRAPGFGCFAYNGAGTLVTVQGNTVCTVTNYYPGQAGYTELPYVNLQGDSVDWNGNVIYRNGLFIIHGRNKIIISSNGINWTYREPPPQYNGTRLIRYTAVEYIGGGVWAVCVIASADSIDNYKYARSSVQIWHTTDFITYSYKAAIADIPINSYTIGFIFTLYNNRLILVLDLSFKDTPSTASLLYKSDPGNFNAVYYVSELSSFAIFNHRMITQGNTIVLGPYTSTDGGSTFSTSPYLDNNRILLYHSTYGKILFYTDAGVAYRYIVNSAIYLTPVIANEQVQFKGNDQVLQHNGYLRLGSWESY